MDIDASSKFFEMPELNVDRIIKEETFRIAMNIVKLWIPKNISYENFFLEYIGEKNHESAWNNFKDFIFEARVNSGEFPELLARYLPDMLEHDFRLRTRYDAILSSITTGVGGNISQIN